MNDHRIMKILPPPSMREDMKPWPFVSHAARETSSTSP